MLKKSRLFVVGIFAMFVFGVLNFNTVFAFSERHIADDDVIRQKVFYTAVITCYKASVDAGGLVGQVLLSDFPGDAKSLIPYATTRWPAKDITYHYGGADTIGCYDLLTKKTINKLSTDTTASLEEREKRLKDAQYVKGVYTPDDSNESADSGNSDKYCYSYTYFGAWSQTDELSRETNGVDTRFTPQLCVKKDENGKYVTYQKDIIGQSEAQIKFKKLGAEVFQVKVGNTKTDFKMEDYENESQFLASVGNQISKNMGSTPQTSKVIEREAGGNENATFYKTTKYYAACDTFTYSPDNSGIACSTDDAYSVKWETQQSSSNTIYVKPELGNLNDYHNYDNYNKLISYYSDGGYNYGSIKFEEGEIYNLYTFYLWNFYGVDLDNILCYDDARNGAGSRHARLWWEDEGKYSEYCYFEVKRNEDKKVNGVDEERYFGKEISLDELIAALNELTITEESESISLRDDDGSSDPCYDKSGALGWFICPIITAVSGVGEHMWNQIETYHLKVPTQEVFEPGNGVEQTWNIIKDIANTLFIMLLLFVLFSQLTGVGIDNYGIKKILPKLILVAVLVNLSYVICKLAVDLSNILGVGLNSMLSGAAGDISIEAGGTTFASWTFDIAVKGGGATLFVILADAPTLLATAAAIGLAVLGLVIVVAVAMLILYVILLIREAGIIIAIVVAPIAFVCYLLPNTEKLFKKWVDLFKALLLVYPICGAMVGAGRLAGVTLASIDNTNMRIAAMVVQVLPFLLIPKVLKGSLKMLGNLGAKISSIGQNLGRKTSSRAQGAIKGSDAYKRFQEDMANKKQERWANRVMNRLGGVDENKLTSRQKMKRSRAADILTSKREREKRGEMMGGSGLATALAGIEAKADARRDADAEAMLFYGNAEYVDSNGRRVKVRPGDTKSVSAYHAASLKKYHSAKTKEEKARAFAELKAAQKRLSATGEGRDEVQRNLENAVRGEYGDAASAAAEHLQRNFGDLYKAKNRGANALIGDLAGGTSMEVIQEKINDDSYNLAGADKYDQSTLAGADDAALANMASAVARATERATDKHSTEVVKIRETARKALEMYDSGKLSINQRALEQIRSIAGTDGGGQSGAGGGAVAGNGGAATTGDSGPTAEGDIFKVQGGKKEKIGTVKIKPKS
ncbi:hypothetical protein IKG29_03540 [Candidatus Saccharibacteria bacterium]|nr:hypothetical protein [Candidatus Saccharibacteria bacterium]